MVVMMSTYVKKKDRMYHFLVNAHQFQEHTLDLLTYKNLKQLASDYGFNEVNF
jgi:hypothetical protein